MHNHACVLLYVCTCMSHVHASTCTCTYCTYFALFVCLTLLASFFLPSHLSFKNMYMYDVVDKRNETQLISCKQLYANRPRSEKTKSPNAEICLSANAWPHQHVHTCMYIA